MSDLAHVNRLQAMLNQRRTQHHYPFEDDHLFLHRESINRIAALEAAVERLTAERDERAVELRYLAALLGEETK